MYFIAGFGCCLFFMVLGLLVLIIMFKMHYLWLVFGGCYIESGHGSC